MQLPIKVKMKINSKSKYLRVILLLHDFICYAPFTFSTIIGENYLIIVDMFLFQIYDIILYNGIPTIGEIFFFLTSSLQLCGKGHWLHYLNY